MHITWTFPPVPSFNTMFMLEAMTFKMAVAVEKSIDPAASLEMEAWTNVYHKGNPEGVWHAIPLDLISCHLENTQESEPVTATYGNSVILTSDGNFAFTFRMKRKGQGFEGEESAPDRYNCHVPFKDDEGWVWAAGYQEDGLIEVRPPSNDVWTRGPSYDHILGPVYLGNFIAASVADQEGFEAVLNLADTLDLITSNFSKPVEYKKIAMRDGAINPIPPELIGQAVQWLLERSETYKKILVNCRAGIGRAGSVVVSYVYAKNPSISYDDSYEYVFSRRFVYPHKGLRDTLPRLYPRRKPE